MSQFSLLGKRRFAPFFWTQALGAFNDNAFRNAMVMLVAFQMALPDAQVSLYTNLAPALFILPYFLFSATAGQLAEKFEKTRLIRFVKLFEIAAMAIAAFGFFTHHISLLLVVLFLADAGLGLLTRVAPALNAFAMGFPLKILLTLALAGTVFVALPGVVDALTETAIGAMRKGW